MEQIKQQIEVTKAHIEALRQHQDACKFGKDEKMVEKLEKQIREEICVLGGIRIALNYLEEEDGR